MQMLRIVAGLLIILAGCGGPSQAQETPTLYPITNFAVVTASIGYDNTATSITLSTGDGNKLPSTFPFYLVWWDTTLYSTPELDPNVEIVQVTNRVSDTLTIVRGQDGTNASNHNTPTSTYKLQLAFVKAYYDRIQEAITDAKVQSTITLDAAFENGQAIDGATVAKPLTIGTGPTECMKAFYDPTRGPVIQSCTPMDKAFVIPTDFTACLYDEESETCMETYNPDASDTNGVFQYNANFKPLASLYVPLSPRGAATMTETNVLTNQPKGWWGTLTDADTDAFDFHIPITKKMTGITTLTVRLWGVSKHASPSGNIQLDCAVSSYRPGTDTYAAHSTTGEQAITLTPATQNRAVSAVSNAITINGTIAENSELIGSCEVNATGTTSAQLTDFLLRGDALIQLVVNSRSD